MIDYALAKRNGPRIKSALTRAMKRPEAERYEAVLEACRMALAEWNRWGAWPDDWSRWQRALDDAGFKARKQPPRLEEL